MSELPWLRPVVVFTIYFMGTALIGIILFAVGEALKNRKPPGYYIDLPEEGILKQARGTPYTWKYIGGIYLLFAALGWPGLFCVRLLDKRRRQKIAQCYQYYKGAVSGDSIYPRCDCPYPNTPSQVCNTAECERFCKKFKH